LVSGVAAGAASEISAVWADAPGSAGADDAALVAWAAVGCTGASVSGTVAAGADAASADATADAAADAADPTTGRAD
jgi:hypothetical protein